MPIRGGCFLERFGFFCSFFPSFRRGLGNAGSRRSIAGVSARTAIIPHAVDGVTRRLGWTLGVGMALHLLSVWVDC